MESFRKQFRKTWTGTGQTFGKFVNPFGKVFGKFGKPFGKLVKPFRKVYYNWFPKNFLKNFPKKSF